MIRKKSSFFRKFITLASLTLYCAGAHNISHAQAQVPEATLKAAIIVNMLMFVDWPAHHDLQAGQLQLCYFNDSQVSAALQQANGRTVKGKTLRTRLVTAENMNQCHAVYLSPSNQVDLNSILSPSRPLPILLVTDTPDYFQRGCMLNLEQSSGRIVFDINLRSARKAGLQISSKALRLARRVIE